MLDEKQKNLTNKASGRWTEEEKSVIWILNDFINFIVDLSDVGVFFCCSFGCFESKKQKWKKNDDDQQKLNKFVNFVKYIKYRFILASSLFQHRWL